MSIAQQIKRLPPKDQRGSRVRCLLLTEGARVDVAKRLSALAAPFATVDATQHRWLPRGLDNPREAKLGKSPELLSMDHRSTLTDWWLAVPRGANTPNWDLASTATVDKREGIILVEAKAHAAELKPEGKILRSSASDNSRMNHNRIAKRIKEANDALNSVRPGWNITVEKHYQLANRFAWSWKIASLGIPVVLVYLGFLEAEEMTDVGAPFADADAWKRMVLIHSSGIVPHTVWTKPLQIASTPLHACIRSSRLRIP